MTEAANHLFAELVGGHTDAHAAVGRQVLSQAFRLFIYDTQWVTRRFYQVGGYRRRVLDVVLQAVDGIDQDYQSLACGTVLDLENLVDGLGVGGVAADSPDGVGWINEDLAFLEQLHTEVDFLFKSIHNLSVSSLISMK